VLTDTKLKNLKPQEKLYKVSDRDGLYVAVLTSGSVSFRYDYRINGRRETLVIGQYGRDGITWRKREELIAAKSCWQASRPLRRNVTVSGRSPAPKHSRYIPTLHETCHPG
jgi:hypothetical protein